MVQMGVKQNNSWYLILNERVLRTLCTVEMSNIFKKPRSDAILAAKTIFS